MYRNSFELRVLVNGKPVKEYAHEGKTFIEAKEGSRYSLKLNNNSCNRAMAIFSVDGVDVIKGKPAEKTKSGYIIDPYSCVEIKGYRISDSEIAEFMFFKGQYSYATGKGKAYNNGVVGVRLIEEKQQAFQNYSYSLPNVIPPFNPYPWNPKPWDNYPSPFSGGYSSNDYTDGGINYCRSDMSGMTDMKGASDVMMSPTATKGMSGAPVEMKSLNLNSRVQKQLLVEQSPIDNSLFDLGTGWGNRVTDVVRRVDFEEGNVIGDMEILYASRQSLERMGIDFNTTKRIVVARSAPKAFNDAGYCKPPKNWNR